MFVAGHYGGGGGGGGGSDGGGGVGYVYRVTRVIEAQWRERLFTLKWLIVSLSLFFSFTPTLSPPLLPPPPIPLPPLHHHHYHCCRGRSPAHHRHSKLHQLSLPPPQPPLIHLS